MILPAIEDFNESGREVILYNPATNEYLDIKVKVRGLSSRAYKMASREISKQRELKNNKFEDEVYRLYFIMASLVSGWDNIQKNDSEYQYSVDNAIELFKENPWVYSQLEEFVEKSSNFFLQK